MKFDPLEIDVPRLLSGLGISAENQGDRWVGLCPSPDHNDSNPSWDMRDVPGQARHGLHKCLSCQYSGTASGLVADIIGVDINGARAWILEHAMGASPLIQSVDIQVKRLDTVFKLPPETIQDPFEEWPATAAAYLTNRRIDAATVKRWHLGYCMTGRLAGRIVVPAKDHDGKLRSYTARTFVGSPKRYLEPKREEHPLPGPIFGEEYWPSTRSIVCVTEGSFNALAVQRVTELPVAALFGVSIELRQLQCLSTFRQALLLTDPDLAGDRAAEKLEMALARHLKMQRVVLEPGTDADSIDPADLRARLVAAYRKLA